ncbi:MAG: Flp pilus assembly complex ATPase component TadA [Planctomycetes bacterium]|nr:Flp pilus assembly complex ATPase component TadA [Planctomycetota bacterium]
MSDDDALGWLDEAEDSPPKKPTAAKPAAAKPAPAKPAPAKPAPKKEVEEDFQDALEWLKESGGDEPADEGAGLDWLGGGDGDAPALTHEEEDDDAGVSIFSTALDDFFEGLETTEEKKPVEADPAATIVTGRRRPRKQRAGVAGDQRVEKVVNTLVRYLTRKDPVRESQLDTIYRLTVGKLVDPLSAEVIIVYSLDEKRAAHFAHLFYSKALFKNHPGLEERFTRSLDKLGQTVIPAGSGILGRAVDGRKSITSLDARADREFENHLGRLTGYEVRTMLTIPICDGEHAYGAIQVMNKDPQSGEEFFSYQDLKLLEEIAAYMGRLIHICREPGLERTDQEIAGYYARLANAEVFDCTNPDLEWDDRLWEVVGVDAIMKFEILPLKKLDSKSLQVIMANPLDQPRRASFEAATDLQIGEVLVSTEAQIKAVLDDRLKRRKKDQTAAEFDELTSEITGDAEKVEIKDGESEEDSSPIIKLVNRIIEDAYSRGASDIHIEPFEGRARVRYRIDGDLQERMSLPTKAVPAILSRIKIMSNLDIAERRLPQDGKIKFKRFSKRGLDLDLRVATGPMAFGEKCVMRLLAKGSIALGLDAMGFSEQNLAKYRWGCKQPYGMVLNVGPTGSGKTTTLYSGLTEVNSIDVNIQTAEDPIEYPLDGINQMQMQKDIGLTFAAALKCYLRMDPDIILVGEIRDLETAEIGIEASLTGHLLFSTLHTNDAAGTVTRFIEMGIEPFMVSSSLLVVCAQRLLRRVCDKCRKEWTPSEREMKLLMRDTRPCPPQMFIHNDARKAGEKKLCARCAGAGYKGRIGTHEVLTLNDELRELINKSASSHEIKEAAVRAGMSTIFQDALHKVKQGITDLEDVMANVKADERKDAKQDEFE